MQYFSLVLKESSCILVAVNLHGQRPPSTSASRATHGRDSKQEPSVNHTTVYALDFLLSGGK